MILEHNITIRDVVIVNSNRETQGKSSLKFIGTGQWLSSVILAYI